jgi:CelD/BcsL family acetyltransferase involved in cellulose biosynthesis
MPAFTTRILTNLRELRDYAQSWDDLWSRSAVTPPTMRAELFAAHVEHFTPHARLWCPVVEDADGRPLAALPLVERRMAMFTCGGFPSNDWSGSGDLLLDEKTSDSAAALDTLVAALTHAPWPLFWFDWAPYESTRWQALHSALQRIGTTWETKPSFEVGRVSTVVDWDTYKASWSRNHRRNMKRFVKRLEEEGPLTTQVLTDLPSAEVEAPLREVFEVENRNWKGTQGTSVLQSEGIWEFYLRQARQLADWGELSLHTLRLGDKPIAAEYGFTAKRVYHPCKIGYDEAYRKESPGNILHMHVIERAAHSRSIDMLDFIGPISQACENWNPGRYTVGRVMFAPRSLFGRAMLGAYRHVWPAVKRMRGVEPPVLSGAS